MNHTGTGYCFDRYEPLDLYTCMVRAWEGFLYKDRWQQLQQRAMSQNFSWVQPALEYLQIYKEVTGQSTELTKEEADKLAFIKQSKDKVSSIT
jgi:starch synthase